jgi:hypothetical protein
MYLCFVYLYTGEINKNLESEQMMESSNQKINIKDSAEVIVSASAPSGEK